MVYMMKDGYIFSYGTHDELMSKEEQYAMLIKTQYTERGNRAQ
jgi:ABC-type multidrug transport system fused ATPase/permease subunit